MVSAGDQVETIQEVTKAVNRASGHLPFYRPSCLPRSLATRYLLRCSGIQAELRLGVHGRDDEFMAHAWVEVEGMPVNDSPDVAERFAPVDFSPAMMKLPW